MKRTFLSKRNALLSQKGIRPGIAVLILAIFIVLLRVFVPNLLFAATAPLFRFSNGITSDVGAFADGFNNASALTQQRDALLSENVALANQNGALSAKIADLETTLGEEPASPPGVTAGVLARPPESPYDTLIVAAGSTAGVAAGDMVEADGGIPVGVVAAVSTNAARITLFSAPGVSTDGWVGTARTPVTLMGEGGGAFAASVPRAASTTVSDDVYVAGSGAIPIGVVRAVGGDLSSPTVTLSISSFANLFSITDVVIEQSPVTP